MFRLRVWSSEIDVPMLKGSTRNDWLQWALLPKFSPMVPIALQALSAKASYVFFPVIPVEASSNLLHSILFSKVSTDYTSMTLIESIRYIFAWE